MTIAIQHSRYAKQVVICIAVMLSACAPVVHGPIYEKEIAEPVWPAAPSSPRLAYVMSFSGGEDLGIGKGILQQLRKFLGGSRQIHLVRPVAIVESADNKLFVADPGVRGVHRFDLEKGGYHLIRGENGQALPSPVALAAGLSGEVYITDSRLAAVFVVEPGRTEAVKVPLQALLARPTGLALDPPSGRLYLVDTGSHEVKVFARDGALLKRFGRRGTGPGEFNFPTMIWMSNESEILVSDSMNFRTQVFDSDGNFLRQFGEVGDGAGHLAQPKGIATDSNGHVYIVDSMTHAIQIFDRSGNFLFKLGYRGEGPGEFWLPAGIFIGERDTIYVADSYNRRIQVFRYIGEKSP